MSRKTVYSVYILGKTRICANSWSRYASSKARIKKIGGEERAHDQSFESLLANSRLYGGDNPVGKTVEAEIIAVVDDHLYVDFGSKLHAVIPKPMYRSELFKRGVKLEVTVKDLEMTQHFLGDSKTSSLLEADVEFVRLLTD